MADYDGEFRRRRHLSPLSDNGVIREQCRSDCLSFEQARTNGPGDTPETARLTSHFSDDQRMNGLLRSRTASSTRFVRTASEFQPGRFDGTGSLTPRYSDRRTPHGLCQRTIQAGSKVWHSGDKPVPNALSLTVCKREKTKMTDEL